MQIKEKALRSDHPDIAVSLVNLALVYQQLEKDAEALSHYQRAAELIVRNLELSAAVQSERNSCAHINISRFYLDGFVSCGVVAQNKGEQQFLFSGCSGGSR